MKKIITILAIAVAVPTFVQAQGVVNFGSSSASQVLKIDGVTAGAGAASASLYYGTVGTSSNSLVVLGAPAVTTSTGFIFGGNRTTGADIAPGGTASFQVRAWTGSFATYELAYAAALSDTSVKVGATTIFANAVSDPTAQPPGSPKNLTGWTTAINLVSVPEPSTIALGMLGAGSLLFVRRKK